MSRGNYSAGKRQRDNDKARKKRDKADKRSQRRERGAGDVPVMTAEEAVGDFPTVEQAMQVITGTPGAGRAAATIPCRLFVGGLSWDTTAESLRAAFAEFGPVADAVVVKDRDTGRSRGFGFVTLENRKDASKAIDGLNGADLDGRNIVVNVATER